MDKPWWIAYGKEASRVFQGERLTAKCNDRYCDKVHFFYSENSGAGAIALAELFGARKIILLGYDCKYNQDGKRHWHEDHPKWLGNAGALPRWSKHFEDVARRIQHCEVVNATRDTALTVWPEISLEAALT